MASVPAVAEGPTAEEQMLMAEASSVSRQTDLRTLRQDKREFIKANRRALAKSPKFGETFGNVQSTDLPPQFRAILEDNRMLHEQIRTYKRELYETQAANTAHDRHIVRLQGEVKRLHAALQDCSRSPDEVNAERNAARTVQHQENDLQKLRDRVSVLAHAKETDARRFRQIAIERQREREDLRREVDSLKSSVAERDKAFRAQAFTLKQANTRVVQLQHQQTEQANREAALLEELSFGAIQGQPSSVESLAFVSEQGTTLRSTTLKRVQSRLPPSMETMRRRLEPIMSSGSAMQDVSLAAGPNDDEESCEEEPSVALMLVVLSQDAIEGFHQQVAKEREEAGRGERGKFDEAARAIQAAWRKKHAQLTAGLRQAQECQAEAAASQAVQERQNSLVSPGRALAKSPTMKRPSKSIRGFQPPQAETSPKSPRRKSTRASTGLIVPNSPSSRSPTNGSISGKERNTPSPLMPGLAGGPDDGSKGSQAPSRQASSVKRPDSFRS